MFTRMMGTHIQMQVKLKSCQVIRKITVFTIKKLHSAGQITEINR